MTILLGIDEAGRGGSLGPLVMVGVLATSEDNKLFKSIGVQDSKAFVNTSHREKVAELVKEGWVYFIKVADSLMVDQHVKVHGLNILERTLAIKIMTAAFTKGFEPSAGDRTILDGHNLFDPLKEMCFPDNPALQERLIIEDHAESKYPVVAAASIIAKTERDQLTRKIMGDYFDNGAGYPNPGTRIFILDKWNEIKNSGGNIDNLIQKYQIRKSWSWCKTLLQELEK